jgi:uncharacterized coiled-coil DUF342 family protein
MAAELPRDLTARESELLERAGQRVFTLSRKVAEANREIDRLNLKATHLAELLDDARRMRDVLADQVLSLQRERDRDYEERAELRRLLASMQQMMSSAVAAQARLSLIESRFFPQRGSGSTPVELPAARATRPIRVS